ncbi:MAG TPA: S8 family serine peptidase, partial [Pirellulales bacterium]|nr:S8 family serine peptidase [Pirellulales bacterium]
PGSISGYKWNDTDGDGLWDSTESPLSGWTVYIDANESGSLDTGELSTVTDENGFYSFGDLQPGSYTIGEVLQSGWIQTYPDTIGGTSSSLAQMDQLSTPEVLVDTEYTEKQLIVKLRDETDGPSILSDLRSMQASLGGTTLESAESLGFELWSIDGDVKDVIRDWGDDPSFQYIQPNYTITLDATVPGDPSFTSLWGLNNTGQTGGVADADIDATEAWDIQTGNNVVVGIIDTGIDYTHPDLIDNMWVNPGEIASNGLDDDGNGYIDDVYGYDFAYGDSDPYDGHSHGTHVAGTIAASGNNGQGVVGVNWDAQLMALKFLSDSGSGSTMNAILAVDYATMMGVRVTNNSWGGGGYSQALYNAIAAAGAAESLFIAAAGNSSSNNDASPHYPSNYDLDNVISVASTTHNDTLSSFSCYGATTVDLGAPGSSIYSTVPGNSYASYSGTSMATPHVAGVAAMLLAENPSLTAAEVKAVILNSVDPIDALTGITVTGGRLNAYNALNSLGVPGTHSVELTWNQNVSNINFGGFLPNQAPVFPDHSFTTAEATLNGTQLGTLTATDYEGALLSYSILQNIDLDADGNGAFRLEEDRLIVNDSDDLDYESVSQMIVTCQASDGSLTDTASVTVNLTDVNDAPSSVSLINLISSIAEDTDTTSGVCIADIVISDDALGTNDISLSGADASCFEATGGQLILKAGEILDYKLKSSYAVTLNVGDSSLAGSALVSASTVLTITPPVISFFAYDETANLASNGSFESGLEDTLWQ